MKCVGLQMFVHKSSTAHCMQMSSEHLQVGLAANSHSSDFPGMRDELQASVSYLLQSTICFELSVSAQEYAIIGELNKIIQDERELQTNQLLAVLTCASHCSSQQFLRFFTQCKSNTFVSSSGYSSRGKQKKPCCYHTEQQAFL